LATVNFTRKKSAEGPSYSLLTVSAVVAVAASAVAVVAASAVVVAVAADRHSAACMVD